METGLLPANFDLIDLIELQLLETVSNVNDDGDIAMADNLRDLELNTMILSQSTRSNVVFRVPYKKICDSQSSNSRLSLELYCKYQLSRIYTSSQDSAPCDLTAHRDSTSEALTLPSSPF